MANKEPVINAAAWPDPLTRRINISLARVEPDGERHLASDFSCASRTIEYDSVAYYPDMDDDDWGPSGALVGLSLAEAKAIHEALDDLLEDV
jgi:hypothetical protein